MHAKRMQHLFVLRNGSTCNSSIEKDKPHIYHGGAPRLVQHASVVVLVVRCYPSRAKVFEPKCPPHHTTIMDGFNDPSHKYAWNIQYTTGQKSALGIVRVSHNQDNNSVTWIFKSGAHARSFKTTHGPPTMVHANWNKGKVPGR